jgi:hypothetical protein
VDLTGWDFPDPVRVIHLRSEADWNALRLRYLGRNSQPFDRCLDVARESGARSLAVETRYIDADYRSEYSTFYSKAFSAMPATSHRLHFFRKPLVGTRLWQLPKSPGYIGYITVRPTSLGPVGRTVLAPPSELFLSCRTLVPDSVSFFGQELCAKGFPFVQQDTQLGRCAQAAAWMCHYAAYVRGGVSRRVIADFSTSADPAIGTTRPLPSGGLTVQQLTGLFCSFGLPPSVYDVRGLPDYPTVPWASDPSLPPKNNPKAHPGLWDKRLIELCCRYLNSGLPIIVATAERHAFVLCGYSREKRPGKKDWITFLAHDDQRGPYLTVPNVFPKSDPSPGHSYGLWESILVPLPEKLWLPPEPAEYQAGVLFQSFTRVLSRLFPAASQIGSLIDSGDLSLRTYAITASRFKEKIEGRVSDELLREYRLARFPRYIWVVEAIDRRRRDAGEPPVLGEIIFDATSSDSEPKPLAVHVPSVAWIAKTRGRPRFPIRCPAVAYETGGVGPP